MVKEILRYSLIFISGAAIWYLGFHMGMATPCNEIEQSDIWPEQK